MKKVLIAVLVLGALVFGVAAVPMQAITNFTNITLSGDLVVGDDATVGDDMTVTDRMTSGQIINTKAATSVVTPDSTVTPLGTYQPISATAGVGTSSITVLPAGSLVRLVNVGAQTITFTDTGTLKLAGNAVVTADDVLTLISDGTNWVQVAAVSAN